MFNENPRKSIKQLALEEPKGVLIKTLVFLLLITSLINYAVVYLLKNIGYQMDINIYNDLITIFTFILISPLFLNFIKILINNSKDELIDFKTLFKIKKYSFKFLLFFTIIILGYYLITLIFSLIPLVGFIINTILLIIFIPSFIIMPYVFLENTNIKLKELIEKSFKIVSGNRIIFYGTIFSFIPWFIIGLFTLCILYLWLIPYIYITITYLYLYLKDEKEFKNVKSLSNGFIIIVTILSIIILNIISFIVYPNSFNDFKDSLRINTNNQTLIYGNKKIHFASPKDYKLVNSNNYIKTYIKDENILQYTIYLSTIKKAIQMDKTIVTDYKKSNDYKEVTDKEFTLKVNNKNLKGYTYTLTKEKEKLQTMIIYYPKDNFIITITLTSKNTINKEDMKKLIKIN